MPINIVKAVNPWRVLARARKDSISHPRASQANHRNSRRSFLWIAIWLIFALLPAAAPTSAAASPKGSSPAALTVGIHDGAINGCDGSETRTGEKHKDGRKDGPLYSNAASSLTSAYWAGLHVSTIRVSVPWDIAYHHDRNQKANDALTVEQLCLNYWLAAASTLGLQPQIAFKPDYNDLNTYTGPKKRQHILVPDIATYRAAMNAFTATYSNCTAHGGTASTCVLPPAPAAFPYPSQFGTAGMARVGIISPWGEPNFAGTGPAGFAQLPQVFHLPGGGTFDNPNCPAHATVNNCGPILAAQMWVAVYHRCHAGCTIIAGDFSGSGGLESNGAPRSYLSTYAAHLNGLRPGVWGVHPYGDIAAFENSGGNTRCTSNPTLNNTLVGRFAAALRALGYRNHTQIWLNEISTFYHYGLGSTYHRTWTRAVQANTARYLLNVLSCAGGRTTRGEPVVTRLYYLRYADGNGFPRWALVVGGVPQPVYTVFANRPNPR